MNSLPIANNNGIVNGTTAKFTSSADHFQRSASRMIGSYSHVKNLEIGLRASGFSRLPRMKIVISTGTSVIDRIDAPTIANVFVNASGRNMRPSCASSRNTGTNDTTMIVSEKKMGRATCLAARMMTRGCSSYGTV